MSTTISVRQFVKVVDRQIHLTLPEGFEYEDVEVIVMPRSDINDYTWEDRDLEAIGKIAHCADSYLQDNEDYSKW